MRNFQDIIFIWIQAYGEICVSVPLNTEAVIILGVMFFVREIWLKNEILTLLPYFVIPVTPCNKIWPAFLYLPQTVTKIVPLCKTCLSYFVIPLTLPCSTKKLFDFVITLALISNTSKLPQLVITLSPLCDKI